MTLRGVSLMIAAALLVATFGAPRLPMQRPRFDHVVVLDVTQSMNVVDVELDGRPVSRLELARHASRVALETLPCGSRAGLAIFTEYRSYLLLAPLEVCASRAELRAALAGIDGRMAWAGNSEIAKGLHSAIGIARDLADRPSLVFVTDGHEAPPLDARNRPHFDDKAGEVPGLVVGVGALKLSPIPKMDPRGLPLGTWGADEVPQVDPRRLGRDGSVKGESMTDDAAAGVDPAAGGAPGSEHLSSLREGYLKVLAGEYGLGYLRLAAPASLAAALQGPALERPLEVDVDLRPLLAAAALVALLVPYAAVWRRR